MPGDFEVPQAASAWRAWAETAALTALPPMLGALLQPSDPFLLAAGFSWAAMGPLLAGLQHGSAPGLASAVGEVALLALGWRFGWVAAPAFPAQLAVGLVLCGLLGGEYGELRRRRVAQLSAIGEQRRERLEQLVRAHQTLLASHERLEEQLARAPSLRAGLAAVERLARVSDGPKVVAEAILNVFVDYGRVQSAALLPVDRRGRVRPALAQVGNAGGVAPEDPLIEQAVRERSVAAIRPDGESLLRVAVPLIDIDGRIRAIVAVREISFVDLVPSGLQLLAALGGHLGDILRLGTATAASESAHERFARDLRRSLLDARRNALPAALVRLRAAPEAEGLCERILAERRSTDRCLWRDAPHGARDLLVLLPLTDERGMDEYLARLEGIARTTCGCSLAEAGVEVEALPLTGKERAGQLLRSFATRREEAHGGAVAVAGLS